MSVEIIKDHTSPNVSLRRRPITMGVIHATVGNFKSSLDWLCHPASRVSSNYLLSKEGVIYELADPAKYTAWHAGYCKVDGKLDAGVNEYSIGYELENLNNGDDPYPDVQVAALTELVKLHVAQFSIPGNRLVRHLDIAYPWGRKSDPAGFPWDTWRAQFAALKKKVTATDGLNIRTGPGINNSIVGKKGFGEVVEVLETANGWSRTRDGWMSSLFLKIV